MRKEASWQQAIKGGGVWTWAQAAEALAACERSGETAVAFARRHGLSPKRLYAWRLRLKKQMAIEDGEPRLVPVTVRGRMVEAPYAKVVVTQGELRIEVGDTNVVSPTWIGTLIRMMREGGA